MVFIMHKAIQIEDLKFTYPDGTEVLRGISISVEEGESIGLIGPNGAGKTTLLLHLNGILKGEGRVSIYGREINDGNLSSIRQNVGLVFQDPNVQLFMPNVFDDVAFGPLNMGLGSPEVKRRVAKALADVDMAAQEERISHHLSLGEKKRVSIATVLSMGPKILALDEPTSNLDLKHRGQLIEILKDLPVTKVIASHDLDMIGRLSSRVAVLQEGLIVAVGQTPEILNNHALLKQSGFYHYA